MKRIRAVLGTLTMVFMLTGVQACVESPTAPDDEEGPGRTVCWWVDGILHCSD